MPDVIAALAQTSEGEDLVSLRRVVAQKDHAVIRAVVPGRDMKPELEAAKAESVKALPEAALQGETNNEALQLTAKLNQARKTLEREHNNVRSELTGVRAQVQQLQHQLDTERNAREIESARASAQIASLEQDLATAYGEKLASGKARSRKRKIRLRIGAAAVAAAVVVAAAVFGWTQLSAKVGPAVTVAAAAPASEEPQSAGPSGSQPPTVIPAQFPAAERGFQGALGELNNALANFPERRAEDVLAAVRRKNAASDPSLCAFAWNGGQPALLYGRQNRSLSLGITLTKCAQAVERLRMD